MASSRFIVTLEPKHNEEIDKAVEITGLSKAGILRLGGYYLARIINSGKLEDLMLDMIKTEGKME